MICSCLYGHPATKNLNLLWSAFIWQFVKKSSHGTARMRSLWTVTALTILVAVPNQSLEFEEIEIQPIRSIDNIEFEEIYGYNKIKRGVQSVVNTKEPVELVETHRIPDPFTPCPGKVINAFASSHSCVFRGLFIMLPLCKSPIASIGVRNISHIGLRNFFGYRRLNAVLEILHSILTTMSLRCHRLHGFYRPHLFSTAPTLFICPRSRLAAAEGEPISSTSSEDVLVEALEKDDQVIGKI